MPGPRRAAFTRQVYAEYMTRAASFASAALLLVLTCLGCRGPETISDRELIESGQWTPADAFARQEIGPEYGPLGPRPVRRPPVARKFASLPGAIETVMGWSYEKTYYHLPNRRAYLFILRDQPAVLMGEEWQQDLTPPPPPPTPEVGWERWRRQTRELLDGVPPPPTPETVSLAR